MRRSLFRQILRRLVLWGAVLMVLLMLFLIVPGITWSWRFPGGSDDPWIALERTKPLTGIDVRQVRVGPFQTALMFVDSGSGLGPYILPWKGAHLEDGTFYYMGDNWMFATGLEPKGPPRFMSGPGAPP